MAVCSCSWCRGVKTPLLFIENALAIRDRALLDGLSLVEADALWSAELLRLRISEVNYRSRK